MACARVASIMLAGLVSMLSRCFHELSILQGSDFPVAGVRRGRQEAEAALLRLIMAVRRWASLA